MRPGLTFSSRGSHRTTSFAPPAKQTVGYAMEKPVPSKKTSPARAVPTLTLDQRRATNAKELERLHGVEEQLKLRKRDLLHSDTEGNRLYTIDLASYNDALAKAAPLQNPQSVDRNYLTEYCCLCRLCSQKRPARQKSGVALPKRKPPSKTVRGL